MYRAHCSLVGTVQRIIFIIYIYQEGFVSISHRYGSTQSQCKECLRKTHDSVSISHRYGSTPTMKNLLLEWKLIVSISHRYGSTTVFTAFHVFIIPYFYRFSIFFSKKVGQPFHRKFPQSLDSTGFFIFVKIDSEVHRLFGHFFAVFGTFPCCFCSGSLDFTALEVHQLFLQIF